MQGNERVTEREAQIKEKMHRKETGRGAVCVSHSAVSSPLQPHGLYSTPSLLGQWNSPGKNTGVGSHSLLQGWNSHSAGRFFTI